jgi:uncharacterized protein YcbK (DUF882 family)
MLRLAVAVLVVSLSQGRAMAQDPAAAPADEGDGESEMPEAPEPAPAAAPTAADAAGAAAAGKKGKAAAKKKKRGRAKVSGRVVLEDQLRKKAPPRPSGNLHLFLLASRETTKVNIYNPDGSYNIESLKAASRMLRCKRTNSLKDVEPRLFVLLSHIYDHFGSRPIEIVSGYRNQRKLTSYHFKASAIDIKIPKVPIRKVKAFAESLDTGGMGIGIYPRAGFVHVDVRPPPSYRWTDYARSDPDNPDKRPPKGWKRRKLTS